MGPKLFRAPAYSGLIEAIWRESLASALWAREIARSLRRNVEVSFLCGLLHQVGGPVVLQAIQELLGPGAAATPKQDAVAGLLREHTPAAGRAVATAWRLPELVTEAIEHVHDYTGAPRNLELVAMVSAARAFAAQTLQDGEPDPAQLCDLPEMAAINLYSSDIGELLAHTPAVRETLVAIAV
jgi:HD-like signal output (HDOD) protein